MEPFVWPHFHVPGASGGFVAGCPTPIGTVHSTSTSIAQLARQPPGLSATSLGSGWPDRGGGFPEGKFLAAS